MVSGNLVFKSRIRVAPSDFCIKLTLRRKDPLSPEDKNEESKQSHAQTAHTCCYKVPELEVLLRKALTGFDCSYRSDWLSDCQREVLIVKVETVDLEKWSTQDDEIIVSLSVIRALMTLDHKLAARLAIHFSGLK
jgi:hypothetical protein